LLNTGLRAAVELQDEGVGSGAFFGHSIHI